MSINEQGGDLICFGIQREVARFQYVHLCSRYVFPVAFRLAQVEREIVLASEDQKRLGCVFFIHACQVGMTKRRVPRLVEKWLLTRGIVESNQHHIDGP